MANSSSTGSRKNLSTVHSKDTLHCLLIGLQQIKILLPNTAVAEVIAYTLPEAIENVPEWFLGNIIWREEKVPLLSFELLSGKGSQEHTVSRIAVLNTLDGNPQLPYIAILIDGIPQLRLIQESNIVVTEDDSGNDVVAASIDLFGETVLIPDIDGLEQCLRNLASI